MSFDSNEGIYPGAKIKVIGVGGSGTNAVSTMFKSNIEGVDFVAANTDMQSLKFCAAHKKIQIGKELTKGLGAGADPNVGRDAALEDRHEILESLVGADMVFITAGMGGGTGTGGASVVSQIAREQGALTVGVVTKPFLFEGKRRQRFAEMGIERLREHVDTLIVIPNQRLLTLATPDLSMVDAFKLADNVLVNAVKGISDIINIPGTINVDFADVKTVMSSMGQALMGIGIASGPNRAIEAANQAISSPLLEDVNIEGATGILINITAGQNISLLEVNEACTIIQDAAHEDANIIFGTVIDEKMGDEIRVTVIATGFPVENKETPHYQPRKSQPLNRYETTSNRDRNFSHLNQIPEQGGPVFRTTQPQTAPIKTELRKEIPVHSLQNQESTTLAQLTLNRQLLENEIQPTHPDFTKSSSQPVFQDEKFGSEIISTSSPKLPQEPLIESTSHFISTDDHLLSDIDKRIDEALKQERIHFDNCEDLEIPAFLRSRHREMNI